MKDQFFPHKKINYKFNLKNRFKQEVGTERAVVSAIPSFDIGRDEEHKEDEEEEDEKKEDETSKGFDASRTPIIISSIVRN